MTQLVKYPKTFHLPWSPHNKRDDRKWLNCEPFEGQQVVITEKMDGENTTMYRDDIHSRSLTRSSHPSRHWVRGLHAGTGHKMNSDMRVCGENLYAVHSMEYKDLESYFLVFNIWTGDVCWSWEDTCAEAEYLGLNMVPVLYEGLWDEKMAREMAAERWHKKREGYVVRLADSFKMGDWDRSIAKYVRPSHVRSNSHWMYQELKVNGLREDTSHNKS